jgi:signal transduction histidine kinase
VSDSGCGFDQGTSKAGMGTRNMSDRLESLDGTLLITSAKDVGTKVTGRVPIPVP